MSLETGQLARQADGAVVVQYGESVVLAAVVAVADRRNVPFFPMMVEYREKQHAAARIPGSIFKREGRPTPKEILTCRIIDRPTRPLFPKGYHQDVQISIWVLSSDGENDPDVLGMVGASAALSISSIPWQGPTASSRVGLVDDEFVINPLHEQRDASELSLIVSSKQDAIVMVEGAAQTIPEEDLLTAMQCAHDVNVEVIGLIQELVEKAGQPTREWEPKVDATAALEALKPDYDRFLEACRKVGKANRMPAMAAVKDEAMERLCDPEKEDALSKSEVYEAFEEMENRALRDTLTQTGKRLDGRATDEIREITCEVGVLPRTHGSALFTRGETQALVTTTLGTVSDEMRILDSLHGDARATKKFLFHYNFPAFCVGEVRPERGPSRRDVGHGDLAERSLTVVLPTPEEFPYTMRVVSDILESNGSSSMASVCGGTLALMDAGCPIKDPVAGIAMGLIMEGDQTFILTDIAGAEDHYGDMDFKVAGTQHGVTAIQMDLKVEGISLDVMRQALEQAREARLSILRTMLATLDRPRDDTSVYAPMLVKVKIAVDSIGKLIGPGGKMIKGLQEEYGVNIDVEDDGTVTVSSERGGRAKECAYYIEQMGRSAEVGVIYDGTVTDLKDFGAIVQLFPGADGLCHISQLDESYVKDVKDVCKIGDKMRVKVLSVEDGRVRLSRKAVLQEEGGSE